MGNLPLTPYKDGIMKNLRTILAACTLATGLIACNAPAVVDPDAVNVDRRTNTAASTDTTSTPSGAGDAERGGPFTVGSGN